MNYTVEIVSLDYDKKSKTYENNHMVHKVLTFDNMYRANEAFSKLEKSLAPLECLALISGGDVLLGSYKTATGVLVVHKPKGA